MTSIEQLRKLAQNPYYKMSEEEKQALAQAENVEGSSPKVQEDSQKQSKRTNVKSKGNAAVKETGKLNKHSSDPIGE